MISQVKPWMMNEEGMSNDYLQSIDWDNLDMFFVTQEVVDRVADPVMKFLLSHTKKEILEGATRGAISICPLLSMEDFVNDADLIALEFWTEIEHPELKAKMTYPKQFTKSSEMSPITRIRAPLIGEHNEAVYGDVGFSRDDLVVLKQAGII